MSKLMFGARTLSQSVHARQPLQTQLRRPVPSASASEAGAGTRACSAFYRPILK